MAMLIPMANVITMAMGIGRDMENSQILERSNAAQRSHRAVAEVASAFKNAGWRVAREPDHGKAHRPDLVVSRRGVSYAVEVKAGIEGRSDRLIPLWSQACLQAARAGGAHAPLAVVAAPKIAGRVADQILKFAEEYAPDAAAGVIDFEGLRQFRGPHLEELSAESAPLPSRSASNPIESAHLFSDLNQWMLKVLLAPEIPDELLSAPRGRYRNASQLAKAATVSVMSAFRFVFQLQRKGYLHESDPYLNVVRREDLFRRWQAAAASRAVNEVPMRFLLRSDPQAELRRMLQSGRACLALFAAADALHLGFVHGVPPYVYMQRLRPANIVAWKNIVPIAPGESPDVILRQAPSPQSVFRGIVRPDGMAACDVIQVWLDVVEHPSRGAEQAELIWSRVLNGVIKGKSIRG
jgi:hypothetical protein